MSVNKRKRTSDGSTASDDLSTDANSPAPLLPEQVPFELQLLKSGQTPKRQKKDEKEWTSPKEENSPLSKGTTIYYRVAPRTLWESMRKYKQFVVQESTFSLGDYVFVNNGSTASADQGPEEQDLWVARVLECRAESPSSVWVRVMYLYWPHELPEHLKRPYYGQREMIVSNHMEIIDAQCVDDKAEVVEAPDRTENSVPATGLYWRQYFDFLENKVSPPLRRDCICKQPRNPDYLLIRCPNDACGKCMHEDCLAKEACKKQWERIAKDQGTVKAPHPDEESIKVDTASIASAKGGKAKAIKKSRGKRKSKAGADEQDDEPWRDVLDGSLERSPPEDESSKEISGICIIKVHTDDGETTVREPLYCLFCETALGTKGAALTPPREP